MITESPCYKCDEREVLCHSSCPRYKKWQAEWQDHQSKLRAIKDMEYISYIAEKQRKKKKREQ